MPQSILLGIGATSALHALDAFFRIMWLAAGGVRLHTTMEQPWLAKSVADFWSKRWDLFVRDMLSELVYAPMRRRGVGRTLAVLAAFGASGFLHAFPILVSSDYGGLTQATQVVLYFIVQACALAIEESMPMLMQTLRKSFWGCKAWVFIVVGLPSGLLVQPYYNANSQSPTNSNILSATISASVAATAIWSCGLTRPKYEGALELEDKSSSSRISGNGPDQACRNQ